MPARIVAENKAADFDSDLKEALAFTVDNVGEVDVEIGFDESGGTVPLPANTSRTFDFIGDRYSGKLYGHFDKTAEKGAKRRVTILKTVFFCK